MLRLLLLAAVAFIAATTALDFTPLGGLQVTPLPPTQTVVDGVAVERQQIQFVCTNDVKSGTIQIGNILVDVLCLGTTYHFAQNTIGKIPMGMTPIEDLAFIAGSGAQMVLSLQNWRAIQAQPAYNFTSLLFDDGNNPEAREAPFTAWELTKEGKLQPVTDHVDFHSGGFLDALQAVGGALFGSGGGCGSRCDDLDSEFQGLKTQLTDENATFTSLTGFLGVEYNQLQTLTSITNNTLGSLKESFQDLNSFAQTQRQINQNTTNAITAIGDIAGNNTINIASLKDNVNVMYGSITSEFTAQAADITNVQNQDIANSLTLSAETKAMGLNLTGLISDQAKSTASSVQTLQQNIGAVNSRVTSSNWAFEQFLTNKPLIRQLTQIHWARRALFGSNIKAMVGDGGIPPTLKLAPAETATFVGGISVNFIKMIPGSPSATPRIFNIVWTFYKNTLNSFNDESSSSLMTFDLMISKMGPAGCTRPFAGLNTTTGAALPETLAIVSTAGICDYWAEAVLSQCNPALGLAFHWDTAQSGVPPVNQNGVLLPAYCATGSPIITQTDVQRSTAEMAAYYNTQICNVTLNPQWTEYQSLSKDQEFANQTMGYFNQSVMTPFCYDDFDTIIGNPSPLFHMANVLQLSILPFQSRIAVADLKFYGRLPEDINILSVPYVPMPQRQDAQGNVVFDAGAQPVHAIYMSFMAASATPATTLPVDVLEPIPNNAMSTPVVFSNIRYTNGSAVDFPVISVASAASGVDRNGHIVPASLIFAGDPLASGATVAYDIAENAFSIDPSWSERERSYAMLMFEKSLSSCPDLSYFQSHVKDSWVLPANDRSAIRMLVSLGKDIDGFPYCIATGGIPINVSLGFDYTPLSAAPSPLSEQCRLFRDFQVSSFLGPFGKQVDLVSRNAVTVVTANVLSGYVASIVQSGCPSSSLLNRLDNVTELAMTTTIQGGLSVQVEANTSDATLASACSFFKAFSVSEISPTVIEFDYCATLTVTIYRVSALAGARQVCAVFTANTIEQVLQTYNPIPSDITEQMHTINDITLTIIQQNDLSAIQSQLNLATSLALTNGISSKFANEIQNYQNQLNNGGLDQYIINGNVSAIFSTFDSNLTLASLLDRMNQQIDNTTAFFLNVGEPLLANFSTRLDALDQNQASVLANLESVIPTFGALQVATLSFNWTTPPITPLLATGALSFIHDTEADDPGCGGLFGTIMSDIVGCGIVSSLGMNGGLLHFASSVVSGAAGAYGHAVDVVGGVLVKAGEAVGGVVNKVIDEASKLAEGVLGILLKAADALESLVNGLFGTLTMILLMAIGIPVLITVIVSIVYGFFKKKWIVMYQDQITALQEQLAEVQHRLGIVAVTLTPKTDAPPTPAAPVIASVTRSPANSVSSSRENSVSRSSTSVSRSRNSSVGSSNSSGGSVAGQLASAAFSFATGTRGVGNLRLDMLRTTNAPPRQQSPAPSSVSVSIEPGAKQQPEFRSLLDADDRF